jgi:phosphohistidine phosphatase
VPFVLDLLRHGEALPAHAGGDAARPLSPSGERAVVDIATAACDSPSRPTRVFASPLLRARQSAERFAGRAAPGCAIETLEALDPDNDPDAVLDALADLGIDAGHVLLVGHQPLLGALAARLTGDAAPSVSPATLIRIECPGRPMPGTGRIVLELRPGQQPRTA